MAVSKGKERICVVCGKKYTFSMTWRFSGSGEFTSIQVCSNECRIRRDTKTCPTCGKQFIVDQDSKRNKYCSIECASAVCRGKSNINRKDAPDKICPICGKIRKRSDYRSYTDFISRETCSLKCGVALREQRRLRMSKCHHCGKEYRLRIHKRINIKTGEPYWTESKFCTIECYKAHVAHKPKRFICKYCGKEFTCDYYRPLQYCSRRCSSLDMNPTKMPRRKRRIVHCQVCGKQIKYKESLSILEGRRKPPRFCSRECTREFKKSPVTYTFTCKECGKVLTKTKLYDQMPIYCSMDCYVKSQNNGYNSERYKLHQCKICGAWFSSKDNKSQYCSSDCYLKASE